MQKLRDHYIKKIEIFNVFKFLDQGTIFSLVLWFCNK
jgi:hypothetical protein